MVFAGRGDDSGEKKFEDDSGGRPGGGKEVTNDEGGACGRVLSSASTNCHSSSLAKLLGSNRRH